MGQSLRGLVATLVVASASAQSLTTLPLDEVPEWQQDSFMQLHIWPLGGGVPLVFDIAPFTPSAGLNLSDAVNVNVQGTMFVATDSSYTDIANSDSVAYLSCDPNNGTSHASPDTMLGKLIENKPGAIVLYSQQSRCCGLGGVSANMPYQSLYTMTAADASVVLTMTGTTSGIIRASITANSTTPEQEKAANQSGNNSAVAMSILYSITGLITLLFLIIIATGAIRAHRYPERYGPRSGYGGRPRQSRAKGIARAVLETLPIVKFGAPQTTPKPDPALELEEGAGAGQSDRDMDRDRNRENVSPLASTVQVHHLSTIPEDAEAHSVGANAPTRESRQPSAADHTEAAGATESQGSLEGDEHLGCTICTEDFTVGEDVRVLPCDHKFHPPCIDPWLVNVSGTCPLCRLDLRPNQIVPDGEGNLHGTAASPLPPPLEPDSDALDGSNTSTVTSGAGAESGSNQRHRRSSRFFDLNRLRNASAEERIEVLRRYRSESRAAGGETASDPDEHSRTSMLTHRLKDRFRIRTRAQSPPQRRRAVGS